MRKTNSQISSLTQDKQNCDVERFSMTAFTFHETKFEREEESTLKTKQRQQ